MKGKQEVICSNEDLLSMYDLHKKKKRILLWLKCKPKASKRSSCDSVDTPQAKRHGSLLTMMNEVSTISEKLKEKHGEKYNEHQLSCWAHMLQSQCNSYYPHS